MVPQWTTLSQTIGYQSKIISTPGEEELSLYPPQENSSAEGGLNHQFFDCLHGGLQDIQIGQHGLALIRRHLGQHFTMQIF